MEKSEKLEETFEELELRAGEKARSLQEKFNLKKVHVIIVEGDIKGDYAVGYFKPLDRITLGLLGGIDERQATKANDIIIDRLMIKDESDERILKDDDFYMAIMPALEGIISLKKSTLKTYSKKRN